MINTERSARYMLGVQLIISGSALALNEDQQGKTFYILLAVKNLALIQ